MHHGIYHYLERHESSFKVDISQLSLSQLADIKICFRSLQTDGDKTGVDGKTKSEEDVMEKNHAAGHFLL